MFKSMRVRKVDPADIDPAVIAEAAAIIRRGGIVAFPTETVYGLGADATSPAAVTRIFSAKRRPSYNPLIVHAADVTGAARCVTAWPAHAQTLASRYWPGPLSLVLAKHESIPDVVSAGLPTVGVRVPNHPVALALIRAAGVPLAAPSANRSMHVSPTQAEHVSSSLGEAADMILDAGPVSVGIESTVLDLSGSVPTVLRPGMISVEDLRRILGRVEVATGKAEDGAAHASPGMMDRHYSPAARVIVSEPGEVIRASSAARAGGAKVITLARSQVGDDAWPMPGEPAEYARVLYAMLHRADAEHADVVVIEAVPPGSAWDGVRDRLSRAAR
jgi:L-threonylcarbamoyladenylate synthase